MFCVSCGKKLPNNSKFCFNCGAPTVSDRKKRFEYTDAKNRYGEKFYSTLSPEVIVQGANRGRFDFDEWIDRTTLDNVWKSRLKFIHEKVINFKDKVVPIGRYIMKIIAKVVASFSGAITGAIIGGILGIMISSIPIFGWVIGPIITPVFVFGGTMVGLASDLKKKLSGADEAALSACVSKILAGKI